ncbi:MAG: hypothetical protein HYU02_04785 [Thaumarchaeota archaeon]|nr:hypothetical protein [Nitrososphaerota archaeon]
MPETLLTAHDRKLLVETKKLMEEVLETEELLADKEFIDSIKRSKRDLRAGKVVSWEQLKRELKSKGKL